MMRLTRADCLNETLTLDSISTYPDYRGEQDRVPFGVAREVRHPHSQVPGHLKSPETNIKSIRAFGDYIVGSLILHFFCVNFIN